MTSNLQTSDNQFSHEFEVANCDLKLEVPSGTSNLKSLFVTSSRKPVGPKTESNIALVKEIFREWESRSPGVLQAIGATGDDLCVVALIHGHAFRRVARLGGNTRASK